MATTEMVDAYVRQLLLDEYGDDLDVLDDGGYEVPLAGCIRVWVTDGNHRTRRVLLTASVLEVDASAEAFVAVNELNAMTPYGRFFHADREVLVEDTLLAEQLEPISLFGSIGFIAWAVETHGPRLAERLGEVDYPVFRRRDVPPADVASSSDAPAGQPVAAGRGNRRRVVNASGYL